MGTAESIALLRQELDVKQHTLADMLGVTITSISRYENGREPSRQVLKKLADIAEDAKFHDLRDIFTAKWKAGITSRLQSLRSGGTERAVALDDLKRWQAAPEFIRKQLLEALKIYRSVAVEPSDRAKLTNANRLLTALVNNFLPRVSSGIEPYINIPAKKGKNG